MANGNLKQVRAYSNAEYKKYYPDLAAKDHSNDPYWKSQKEILGFKNGYVTIFKGDTYPHKEWFKENGCQYRKWWGWSLSSEAELPEELPEGVEAIRLNWEDVGEGESLKNDTNLIAVLESLVEGTVATYNSGNSTAGDFDTEYTLAIKVLTGTLMAYVNYVIAINNLGVTVNEDLATYHILYNTISDVCVAGTYGKDTTVSLGKRG